MTDGGPRTILCRGDNLPVMEALLPRFGKRCKLVLVDPPYNARNRKDYPDERRHDEWLEWLEERLRLACRFLSDDGILACHIDDAEQAYLHVLLDRILGRERHLNTVCVKMSELSGVKMRYQDRMLPRTKEFVLFYGTTEASRLKPLRRAKESDKLAGYADYYRWFLENPDDPVEIWRVRPVREAMKERGLGVDRAALDKFRLDNSCQMVYRTNNRWFDSLDPADRPAASFARLESPWGESYVWWEGKQMLFLSDHLDEPLGDIWTDISTINLGREGGVALRSGKKPEALVERIVGLATDPGDWILDPFCGSGTTPAVARKRDRNCLSIEIDHEIADRARTRLESVHSGRDTTGIATVPSGMACGGFELVDFPDAVATSELPVARPLDVSHLSRIQP